MYLYKHDGFKDELGILKNGFHVVAHARMPMNQLKIKSKRKRLIIRFARASPGEKPTLEVSAKVDTS